MNIGASDLLFFSFHEGFTERLISGELWLTGSGKINYIVSAYPEGKKSGELSLDELFVDEILNFLTSNEKHLLLNEYESGCDDFGFSYFEFRLSEGVKSVKINEIIDRQSLSNMIERRLFYINDKLIRLIADLICS